MSSERVHIVVASEERATFRAAAAREGLTLSEWLRQAARDRLAASAVSDLDTVEELDAFFTRCDEREGSEREPDWAQHLAVIEASRGSGGPT